MRHNAQLALGRTAAEKKVPYFMDGIYGLVPYIVEGLGTMGVTEGLTLIYDPEWLTTIPVEEVGDSLIHEAIHVHGDHCARIKAIPNVDRDIANIAADIVANDLLLEMGVTLPNSYLSSTFDLPKGKTLEWYYAELINPKTKNKKVRQLQRDQQQEQAGGGGGKKVDGGAPKAGSSTQPASAEASDTSEPPDSGKEKEDGAGGATSPDNPKVGSSGNRIGRGRCGGIAGNPIDKALEDRIDQEVAKETGSQQGRVKDIQQRIDAAIQSHIEAHGRGSVPGSLKERISRDEEPSKVRWQNRLRNIAMKVTGMLEAGGMDFSLAVPSKRSYARGMLRPGLVQYQPEPCFIIDSSGSMGQPQLRSALRETVAIMKTLGIDMAWVLQADTQVAAEPKRMRIRQIKDDFEIHGRGGTSFDNALEKAMTLKPRPDIIFYLTDGDGYVTVKPPVPTVWVVVPGPFSRKPAEWGYTVFVDDNK